MDDEMMRALEADGEKLRAMTGEDHGPYFLREPREVWVAQMEDGTTRVYTCDPRWLCRVESAYLAREVLA